MFGKRHQKKLKVLMAFVGVIMIISTILLYFPAFR